MDKITITRCPVCGHDESVPFFAWGYGAPCNRIPVRNVLCRNCGLVYLNPRPSPEWMREYYAEYVKRTQSIETPPLYLEDHLFGIARLRSRFLLPHLRQGDRVLDIGCSYGAFLKVLRDESGLDLSVRGINPEPGTAAFARKAYGLDVAADMLEDLDLPAGSCDCIVLDNVIEHLSDQTSALDLLHSLLAEGGRLFISTNTVDRLHGFPWQNFFADHTVTYSPRTLAAHLRSRGFAVIAHEQDGHITWEGHHYPYQNCLAVKTDKPAAFDFAAHGDDWEDRLRSLRDYTRAWRRQSPWSRRLFEIEHGAAASPGERSRTLLRRRMAEAGEQPHVLRNHTLPPEEYWIRRVVLSQCTTERDSATNNALLGASGLNPEYASVVRRNGALVLDKATPEIRRRAGTIPDHFTSMKEAWEWLNGLFPKIDERIEIKLNNADIPQDALGRYARQARISGADRAIADFSFFTDAFIRWERPGASGSPIQLLGPDRQDALFFFREKGETMFASPRSVSLDLSPLCNKRCDKCQFHSPRSPYKGLLRNNEFMPLDLAKALLDDCATITPKPCIMPTFSGEPLLYPHLESVLRHAADLGLPVGVTTNGLLLDRDMSRLLLDTGVTSVMVSLDAFRPETYAALQAPGSLERVTENVLQFRELRGESSTPTLGLVFVQEQRNAGEWEEYLEYWRGRVDLITRSLHQDQFGSNRATMPFFTNTGKRMPCLSAWTSMYLRWDGKVSFCGFDIGASQTGLNARNQRILDIWRSEPYRRWREAQIANDMSVLYCKACPDWSTVRRLTSQEPGATRLVTPVSETWTFA